MVWLRGKGGGKKLMIFHKAGLEMAMQVHHQRDFTNVSNSNTLQFTGFAFVGPKIIVTAGRHLAKRRKQSTLLHHHHQTLAVLLSVSS